MLVIVDAAHAVGDLHVMQDGLAERGLAGGGMSDERDIANVAGIAYAHIAASDPR